MVRQPRLYDRKALTFRCIDVVFACAWRRLVADATISPASAHFNTIGYTPMQVSSMKRIFQTMLGNFLTRPGGSDAVKNLAHGSSTRRSRSTARVGGTRLTRPSPIPVQPRAHQQGLLACSWFYLPSSRPLNR